MTVEKFENEINTLKKFYKIYCEDKHKEQEDIKEIILYKEKYFELDLHLCNECLKDIRYSIEKLQTCVHEIKPRCRNCPNPCYEKTQWKKTAKVMKYGGIKLGLSSIKNKVLKIFK
ncbi:nitrous oxide-stimulated promoter family protein [Malaciobacter mytili]|uniref:Nitrous oxide-regulated protein n=1 Tax=Malaciobacter mytili LMG 24559 TaxID=1032238 RepID=A0AAX2AFE5_9BACT|nr:nitrous oxide-stimulated promoter family protein [Malaciobacter mytili]AXH16272.1 putative nitrous oxide-regulated protein [Malaciobacter mytili LMG 24559]RXK13785.1 hypothetical protein CP985_12620 [Malaciobacter mytili LMG 24559]